MFAILINFLLLRHVIAPEMYKKYPFKVDVKSYDVDIEVGLLTQVVRFNGHVKIVFTPYQNSSKQLLINWDVFNTEPFTPDNVTLKGNSKSYTFVRSFVNDTSRNLITMEFTENLPIKEELELEISYIQDFFEDDSGFCSIPSLINGTWNFVSPAYFYKIYADLIFPCFNNVDILSKFSISLTHPQIYKSWGNVYEPPTTNKETGQLTTKFDISSLPLHSLGFVIAPFVCTFYPSTFGVELTVCSKPGEDSYRWEALNLAADMISYLEVYINITCKEIELTKIDLISVTGLSDEPIIEGNAMASWGLVICNEFSLLWNEEKSTIMDKQNIAVILALSLTSMWVTNLLTIESWSENFLLKGLELYLHYHVIDEVKPSWSYRVQFLVQHIPQAFELDEDPEYVNNAPKFMVTSKETPLREESYLWNVRSGAIFRMFAHVMGRVKFYDCLMTFLKTNKRNVTRYSDFAGLLSSSFGDSTEVYILNFMNNWGENSGYPIINAKLVNTDVILTQESSSLVYFDNTWYIPLTYTTSREVNFRNTTPRKWFKPYHQSVNISNQILNHDDWIVFNILRTGFYRIHYDDNLLGRIKNVLDHDVSIIPNMCKAQIIDDLFFAAKKIKTSYDTLFNFLGFLKHENDYFTWTATLRNFKTILISLHSQETRQKLLNFIKILISHLELSFKIDENTKHIYKLKQIELLEWVCTMGSSNCLHFAKVSFKMFEKGFNIQSDIAHIVYCTILKHGDEVTKYWKILWDLYQNSLVVIEQRQILKAFGCAIDHNLVQQLLTALRETNVIPAREHIAIYNLLSQHPTNRETLRKHIAKHFSAIIDELCFASTCLKQFSQFIANRLFTKKEQLDVFVEDVNKQKLNDKGLYVLETVKKLAPGAILLKLDYENELNNYFTMNSQSKLKLLWRLLFLPFFLSTGLF